MKKLRANATEEEIGLRVLYFFTSLARRRNLPFSFGEVKSVVKKVQDRLQHSGLKNLEGYAYRAVANLLTDKQRRNEVAEREEKNAATIMADKLEAAHAKERARREFDVTTARLIREAAHKSWLPSAVEMARLQWFDDCSDAECLFIAPKTTADQRYQWLRRLRVLLLASCDPDLRACMARRMWGKPQ